MDEHIAGIIVAYLGGPYCARALRATSRVWRELIQRPKKCSPNVLACEAARIGNLELCKFACSRGASRLFPVASIAAKKGYREICEFVKAKDWFVDSLIVRKASRRGHFDLCTSFGTTMFTHVRDVTITLGAARIGDKKRLFTTIILGDNLPWYRILKEAARGGQREILDQAMLHEASRNALCDALYGAARGGHREICDALLREIHSALSESESTNILIRAARGGHREMCELARELGARDYMQMMYGAAKNNRIKICMLAREWLAESDHPVNSRMAICTSMRIAAERGHDELCMLLCDWGASNLPEAYNEASESGYYELRAMIKWRACVSRSGYAFECEVQEVRAEIVRNLEHERELEW
jgi:hypothetical protein